jgi:hypothetical protein
MEDVGAVTVYADALNGFGVGVTADVGPLLQDQASFFPAGRLVGEYRAGEA